MKNLKKPKKNTKKLGQLNDLGLAPFVNIKLYSCKKRQDLSVYLKHWSCTWHYSEPLG